MKEKAKTKRFDKAVMGIGLTVIITGSLLVGCAARGTDAGQTTPPEVMGSVPGDTTPAVTTIFDMTSPETTPEATIPETTPETTPEATVPETTPAETIPATTDEDAQPPVTTPEATQPPVTTPKPTQPKPTHTHDYQAGKTVAATCETQGYTEYTCSCGNTVKRDYTAALGHSYTETRKEATCQEGGYTTHTCQRCGKSYEDGHTDALAHAMEDATVDGCPVKKCRWCDKQEFTDATLAWLERYAIDYAVSQGYEYCPGLRDGYYPGNSYPPRTLAEFKQEVMGTVDLQTQLLEARGHAIWGYLEDGTIGRALFDFRIEVEGDGWYCLWAYYG